MNKIGRSTVDAHGISWHFVAESTSGFALSFASVNLTNLLNPLRIGARSRNRTGTALYRNPRILSPDPKIDNITLSLSTFKMFSFSGPKYGRSSCQIVAVTVSISRAILLTKSPKDSGSDFIMDGIFGDSNAWQELDPSSLNFGVMKKSLR